MTMTETRPDAADHASADRESAAPAVVRGPLTWLQSADPTRTAKLFIVSGLLGTIASSVLLVLAGIERAKPASFDILASEIADQVRTMGTYGLAFVGVLPLMLGLAVGIAPLQVGASTLAFPRAASFGYWLWLCGTGAFIGSYVDNGGPGGGDPNAILLFLLAFGLIIVGLLCAAVCVATTVLAYRAPRMSLRRVPAFAFASLVHSTMLLTVLPVLLGNLIYLFVSQRYYPRFGGNKAIDANLAWVVRQPSTILFMVPLLGVVLDIVPVMARNRLRFAGVGRFAIGLAGVVGFGAWAQPAIAPEVYNEATYTIFSLLSPLPAVIVLGLCALTLKTGRPRVTAPLAAAMAALLMAAAGASLGGLIAVDNVLDLLNVNQMDLIGSAAHDGQYAYMVLAGALGALAGLAYWGPKLWGQMLGEKETLPISGLGLIAIVLAGLPLLIAGFLDQPASIVAATTSWSDDTDIFNILSGVGFGLFALTGLIALAALAKSVLGASSAVAAGPDPWGGATLEWHSASPPKPGNFPFGTPPIKSSTPLLDAREASA
jgi:heme/copper-type cytochrome/quinol oxidase subunit 1